jgi:hypothetical protein
LIAICTSFYLEQTLFVLDLYNSVSNLSVVVYSVVALTPKREYMKRVATTELISSLLILLFVYTGLSKLYSVASFEAVLQQSPLISSGAGMLAWQLPLTELCIVLLLFFPSTRLVGLYGSLLLLSLFTFYLLYMLLFTPHLPCSCGGVIGSLGWKEHVGLNLVFIVLTVIGIRKLTRDKEFRV